jgi:hypothetical protein
MQMNGKTTIQIAPRSNIKLSFTDSGNKMLYHYVTITGVYIDRNMDSVCLRVQSWGRTYYIDYDEFCDYNSDSDLTWSGNIIIIDH